MARLPTRRPRSRGHCRGCGTRCSAISSRVLASAIGELRRSVKCQPVIFELMPDVFTLFELQKTVEAILGPHLHKQNFRRLVETGGLVEPTGEFRLRTGGRPAQLYRFRRDVLLERPPPACGSRPDAGDAMSPGPCARDPASAGSAARAGWIPATSAGMMRSNLSRLLEFATV